MKGVLKEFTDFINRGNVVDLAIAVIIGIAFGKIITSFVVDILTPLIGIIAGGINFSSLAVVIGKQQGKEVVLAYGKFLQTSFDFLLTAVALFLVIKLLAQHEKWRTAKLRKDQTSSEDKPAEVKEEVLLLREIRDNLKNRSL